MYNIAIPRRRIASIAALSLVTILVAVTRPHDVGAQVRASERSTISQTADGTILTINYSRPQSRGRTELYGKTIHWGEIWTPGANWATTLDVSRDVTLDGHPVRKGKYSVWFIVGQNDWTVILDPKAARYHTEPPKAAIDTQQVRWTVRPTEQADRALLTWSFPEVRPDGTQLQFEWGTKRVVINATVAASHPLPIARADAEPFIGTYEWRWSGGDTPLMRLIAASQPAIRMELFYEDGKLLQRYTPTPEWYPRLQGQAMARINDTWFIPAIVRDGKLWEMVADMIFEFTLANGKAVSFELRDDRDELLGSGKRVTP